MRSHERFESCGGIGPTSWLFDSVRSEIFMFSPSGHGSSSVQPAPHRPPGCGPPELMLPSSVGIVPSRRLKPRLTIWMLLIRPISVGIAPPSEFHERSRYVRLARSPSSGIEKLPVMLFRGSASDVTRPAKQPIPAPRSSVR